MTRFLPLLALLAAPVLAQPAPAGANARFAALDAGLAFAENRGQWPDEVLFEARLGGVDVWVTADGVVFDFYAVEGEDRADADAIEGKEPEEMRRRGHVVAMRFEGGRAPRAVGHGLKETYHNYFLGNDPSRWAGHVPLYDEVVLEGLYDGVDLRLYSDGGRLRYDLVVAPGADASRVRMRLEGADGVAVTAEGSLRVETALGPVEHRGLQAYQEETGGRREAVGSTFVVGADGAVGFRVSGVDAARRLVLDPLIWSTFLGGSIDEQAYAVAVGEDGAATVAGYTYSADFPATPGAYDTTHNGFYDAFVARLSADGATLLYATYLGGTGISTEYAYAVAVGPDGSANVAGVTTSEAFPTTSNAFDPSYNGNGDAFVTRLSPDGATLLYSTFLGGSQADQASGIVLNPDGGVTAAGGTYSTDFPVTPGAFDTSYNGGHPGYGGDVFLARLSPDGSSLTFATYLGGASADRPGGVGVGVDGSVTVVGWTEGAGFPVTPGAFDITYNGGFYDAFVARLSADGTALLYATYLGGASIDQATGVGVGPDGSATVVGGTPSADFPVTPGAFDTTHNGHSDGFVTRLSADGSDLLYSTLLGGTGYDTSWGIALGEDGSATVVGETLSEDFPVTPGAFDTSHNGFTDAFVTRLSADGAALLYGSFLGSRGSEVAYAVGLDTDERATVVGYTRSAGFPTTPDAYDTSLNGRFDAFVARFAFELPPFVLTAGALNSPVPRGDALRFRVTLTNNSPGPFHGDLTLDVESQGGVTASRTLFTGATLPPWQTAAPTFTLRVPEQAPLGLYTATVTALEAGTDPLGEATFVFRVVPVVPGEARADGTEAGGAPWAVVVLDSDGLDGPFATAAAAAQDSLAVWPNPASSGATLAFTLDRPSAVRLALYDVLGRAVLALDAGRLEPGPHRLALDVSQLSAGVYVWRLTADGRAGARTEAGRLTVAR